MIREVPAFIGNYRVGRAARVDTIVIHTTAGTFASALAWFAQDHKPFHMDPTSAHLVVSALGDVARCVADEDTAFHAGNFPVNMRSVGIECEGLPDRKDTWTEPMFDALLDLCAVIVKKFGIPVDRTHIIGHYEVPDPYNPKLRGGAGHNKDPGPFFPWDRFITALLARTSPQGDIS